MLSILLMVKQCKASLTCAINFARIKDITSSSLGIICFFGTITDLVTKRFCTLFPSLVVVMTQIHYKWYSYLHLKNHVERFLCALSLWHILLVCMHSSFVLTWSMPSIVLWCLLVVSRPSQTFSNISRSIKTLWW